MILKLKDDTQRLSQLNSTEVHKRYESLEGTRKNGKLLPLTHRNQEFCWLVARDLMIKASMLETLARNREKGLCPFRAYYTNYQIAVYKDTNKV